jgi:hypothetical protein
VVLIVRVDVWLVPAITATVAGLNAQEGAGVAVGVTALHESVTFPAYPFTGVTVITAVAPLPACTLPGEMAVVTEIVYTGDTASTVMFKDSG